MMDLIVMRHGEASFGADSDALRELTPNGRAQALRTAKQLKPMVSENTLIYYSPFVRTEQTARLVADCLSLEMKPEKSLQAGTDYRKIIEWLQAITDTNIIVISHNPMVSQLTNALVYGLQGQSLSGSVIFDTGYASCMSCDYPAYGCVDLVKMIKP